LRLTTEFHLQNHFHLLGHLTTIQRYFLPNLESVGIDLGFDQFQEQFNELAALVDQIELTGFDFVNISEINLDSTQTRIPDWVKNNAGWWSDGLISDNDFVQGIQYLIQQSIIIVPETGQTQDQSRQIPDWVKNNAGWWSDGLIGENDFVNGIQWLISNGILRI